MTKGADLYQLQRQDSERDVILRRLAEIEAEMGETEALQLAQQAVE